MCHWARQWISITSTSFFFSLFSGLHLLVDPFPSTPGQFSHSPSSWLPFHFSHQVVQSFKMSPCLPVSFHVLICFICFSLNSPPRVSSYSFLCHIESFAFTLTDHVCPPPSHPIFCFNQPYHFSFDVSIPPSLWFLSRVRTSQKRDYFSLVIFGGASKRRRRGR